MPATTARGWKYCLYKDKINGDEKGIHVVLRWLPWELSGIAYPDKALKKQLPRHVSNSAFTLVTSEPCQTGLVPFLKADISILIAKYSCSTNISF